MKKKTVLKLAGGVLLTAAALTAAYGAASEIGFNRMMKRSKKEYDPLDGLQFINDSDAYEEAQMWLKTVPSEDMFLHGFDDTRLFGQKIMTHPASKKWVILVHGWKADHRSMALCARVFDTKGYNCLLVDLRGHGKTEGDYCTMGWTDRLDLICWINMLTVMHPGCEIVLYGRSMGATACMNATGEKLGPEVKACISDCGFSNAEKQSMYMLQRKKNLKFFALGMKLVSKLHLKFSLKKADTCEQLKKSNVPTLFIHGEKDQVVPFNTVFENYYACSAEKELYTVHDAKHLECINQESYWDRVFKFIDRNC
ncbi:MAG: alpha/beta hydrolase [Erysipelotrichaceae bacterium]|nr:alpha/beta hydrolase [Erysipelotrichaceae bacterium]